MKLTKERLKALISQEITNSLGFYGGELSSQRKNAHTRRKYRKI